MFKLLRGAAFAAAVIGASMAPTFAQPSLAWQAPAGVSISQPKIVEAVAAPEQATLQAEPMPQPATVSDKTMVASDVGSEGKSTSKSLAELVKASSVIASADGEMTCLARAVYFESKGEPLSGQLAVAQVIINRAKSGRYPSSICGVVKQPGQFSFVRGGRLPSVPEASSDWHKAVAIAHIARNALARSLAPTALAFHAAGVSPGWRLKRVASIGRHIFYR